MANSGTALPTVLHRETMDLMGSADRREQLRAEYPGCALRLVDTFKDHRGFTMLTIEVVNLTGLLARDGL